MTALTIVVVWLACGAITVVWNSYTEEDPFGYHTEIMREHEHVWLPVVAYLGPFSLFWLLLKRLQKSAITARKEKTRIAAELEKELADARREIDAMLKRETRAQS